MAVRELEKVGRSERTALWGRRECVPELMAKGVPFGEAVSHVSGRFAAAVHMAAGRPPYGAEFLAHCKPEYAAAYREEWRLVEG